MSNDDIEDVFLRNCCYPGCSDEMFMCPVDCGYQYPLCKMHFFGGKIYLTDELLSSQINDTGIPSAFNIWHKNRFIVNDRSYFIIEEQFLSLHQCSSIIKTTREFSDKPIIIVLYTKDKYPGWYDSMSSDEILNRVSKGGLEIHTYKYKLYKMRTSCSYFGAMPLDILNEVIKYL